MFSIFAATYLAQFSGCRPTPANWGIVSTERTQYVSAYCSRADYIDCAESFISYRYVGDGAFLENCGFRHWKAVSVWGDSLMRRLGAKVLRCAKREIECNTAAKILLWGVAVCTDTETFSAPRERIDRALEFLVRSVMAPGLHVYPLGGCVNYAVSLSYGPSVTVRWPSQRPNWPASFV